MLSAQKRKPFYIGQWEVFKNVPPSERHVVGTAHMYCIEIDNSDTMALFGQIYAPDKDCLQIMQGC
jgi:hypothetical protein